MTEEYITNCYRVRKQLINIAKIMAPINGGHTATLDTAAMMMQALIQEIKLLKDINEMPLDTKSEPATINIEDQLSTIGLKLREHWIKIRVLTERVELLEDKERN